MQERRKLFEVKDDLELEKIRAKKMQEMTKKKKDELVSSPLTVTDENFEETINKHPLMVIDCWAAWCGPCRMVAPIIDELANDHAGEVVFGKLNVDENPLTATQFNVMSIPTLLIMKNGKEVDRMVGAAPKLLIENKVKKYI
ncbi:MAG: thioredoxin [Candidatus Bathyarchaeota archaeon]|nr:MAG: thioredoxin [Candidatus Bathyarchaeota archaeon]